MQNLENLLNRKLCKSSKDRQLILQSVRAHKLFYLKRVDLLKKKKKKKEPLQAAPVE